MTADLFGRTVVVNITHGTPFDVYCGRPGRGYDSPFGNPHTSSRPCPICSTPSTEVWHSKKQSIGMFATYFLNRVTADADFRAQVLSLKGKVLGCFCVRRDGGGLCHVKVIAEWVDSQSG